MADLDRYVPMIDVCSVFFGFEYYFVGRSSASELVCSHLLTSILTCKRSITNEPLAFTRLS